MTNEELTAKVTELEERVRHANGVLLGILTEKEADAMMKACTAFKAPRDRGVDSIGAMIRPWLTIVPASMAKEWRGLPLDAVAGDLTKLGGRDESESSQVAKAIRDFDITWDEIGVDPDGSVRPDSMATPPTFGKAAKETAR